MRERCSQHHQSVQHLYHYGDSITSSILNNDTSRNIGKGGAIEYKNLFAFGRSSNHFIGCIANIEIVILNSIVFLNHKAVIGKVIAFAFRFVVGRVKVLECTAGYIDACCSVLVMGIIAVQNKLISLCRIRIFLLNRVGAAFDISCSSKNIYSMDITNEGTILIVTVAPPCTSTA